MSSPSLIGVLFGKAIVARHLVDADGGVGPTALRKRVVHAMGAFPVTDVKPLLMPSGCHSETTLCGWWAGWMSPIRWYETGSFQAPR